MARLDDFENIILDEDMLENLKSAATDMYPKFELKVMAVEPGSQESGTYVVAQRAKRNPLSPGKAANITFRDENEIGDIRIKWKAVRCCEVSVMAQHIENL